LEVNTSLKIFSGSLYVTGGIYVSGSDVVLASGSSFYGDGSGLRNINIANLSFETSILRSGSAFAEISPDLGFRVSTSSSIDGNLNVSKTLVAYDITGSHRIFSPLFTGSFFGTYKFQGVGPTASAEYDILRYNETQGYYIPQPETSLTETVGFSNVSDLTIVHNLDIRYPMVQIYATGSEDQIMAGTIKSIDSNTIQIKFAGLTSGHAVIGSGGSLISGTIPGDRVFGNVLSASHAEVADFATGLVGFDSGALAALGDLQNFVRNSQTSSMRVAFAVSSSHALTASYVADLSNLNLTDYVKKSQTASMTVVSAYLAQNALYALFAQNA
jgi:hypothetical protein